MRISPADAASMVAGRHAVLLLDFDGTLSPIVGHAGDAYISPIAKDALRSLVRHMPVAIVSGRALKDVRTRVGLRGVAYAGSHGYETAIHGHYAHYVPRGAKAALRTARIALTPLVKKFPGAHIEEKAFGVVLHYRSVASTQEAAIRRDAAGAVAALVREGSVRVHDDNKAFDVHPNGDASKASAVNMLARELATGKTPLPVYIGDALTDEDAFRALSRGITIRVGYKKASAARFHFQNRDEVDEFLRLLATSGTGD